MTILNRVGSVTLLNNTLGDINSLQAQLGDLQQQISSGVKAQDFKQLNGQVEQYTLLESKMRRTQAFMEMNEVAVGRMQTADQALGQVQSTVDNMEDLIVAARSATGGELSFVVQMKNLLESMQASLNISFDGRYLFAGTSTNTLPVSDILTPPQTNGVPDASYYDGSSQSMTQRLDDNIEYAFPVRADDAAFQKIYAAAHQAIKAFETKDDAAMGQALTLLQQGQDALVTSRADVNTAIININNVNDSLKSMNLYWTGVTEKVGKTDIVAATTQIASYEAVLQATFQVYARLSQLKLSDYL